MKYRRLTKEELESLKQEFIHFLITNGIDAPEWQKISEKDKEKANLMVDLFSDLVFEKALKNIKFLEHVSPKDIKYFFITDKKIVLACIKASNESSLDFTNKKTITSLSEGSIDLKQGELTYFSTEKDIIKEREQEVFELMQEGAEPCLKEKFDSIYSLCRK